MSISRSLHRLFLPILLLLHGCHAFQPVEAPPAQTAAPFPAYEGRAESFSAAASERPGLGTEWGEKRTSRVSDTTFERATPARPAMVSRIYYNDAAGMRAMLGYKNTWDVSSMRSPDDWLAFTVQDEYGRPWPTVTDGEDYYVTGEPGRRYAVRVENRTASRLEVVLSVDGLDVLDGKPAAYAKRGYVIAPRGMLLVEGFRSSSAEVAVFRFSSVGDSYAARKHGDTRNVGVIGLAVFDERGDRPGSWLRDEVPRREAVDPFPGRFATPP